MDEVRKHSLRAHDLAPAFDEAFISDSGHVYILRNDKYYTYSLIYRCFYDFGDIPDRKSLTRVDIKYIDVLLNEQKMMQSIQSLCKTIPSSVKKRARTE